MTERCDEMDRASMDPAALEALHPEAWRWALACCRGDRETAMEALQESYLAVLEGRARFGGRSTLKTFLFGVIRNMSRATRRKAFARALFFAPIETAGEPAAPADQERAADLKRIDAAFAALSTRQREVADLVLSHGFTVTEAAEALGLSRGGASRHYAAAKAALRKRLGVTEAGDG